MFRYVIIPPLSFLLFTACFLEGFKKKKKKQRLPSSWKKILLLNSRPSRTVHPEASFLCKHPCTQISHSRKSEFLSKPLKDILPFAILCLKKLSIESQWNICTLLTYRKYICIFKKKKTRLIIKSYVRLKRWKNKRALLHVCRIKARKKFKEKLKKNEHDEATC